MLLSKTGQPFLIAGSGTLGWDQVASNLIEPGEDVLVLATGYFGDSFTDWCVITPYLLADLFTDTIYSESLQTYGAKVTQVTAPLGAAVSKEVLEK